VTDAEVLAGVRDHTTGATGMPMIARIILIADKIEQRKRKRDPVMKLIRQLARRDLDNALLCWADWKWVEERENDWLTHPRHWAARVEWVAEHHADAEMPGRVGEGEFAKEV
jgi:HD superfamily phosphohydrolase YqeK